MSVLAGWLGRPWASGVFSSVLSQGVQGWAELLSDVEKSSLWPPASSSPPYTSDAAYQELLCVQCASSKTGNWCRDFFFFLYQLIRPNGFHGCSNKAQKKT